MEKNKMNIPTIEEELKNYNREKLIEEIARLRVVLVKGNLKAYQKAKKIFLDDKKEFIKELKEEISNIMDVRDKKTSLHRMMKKIDKLAKKYGCDNQKCTNSEIDEICDVCWDTRTSCSCKKFTPTGMGIKSSDKGDEK